MTKLFDLDACIEALDYFSTSLVNNKEFQTQFIFCANNSEEASELKSALDEIISFLQAESLQTKVEREFGDLEPFEPQRTIWSEPIFESWVPLGTILHIAPSNSFAIQILTLVEGLLTGNYNILKPAPRWYEATNQFVSFWQSVDRPWGPSSKIRVLDPNQVSDAFLKTLIETECQAVVVWGGTQTVEHFRKLVPTDVKLIAWGHRISFALVSAKTKLDQDWLKLLVKDVLQFEQMACSAPQILYVEDASFEELNLIGQRLQKEFNLQCENRALPEPIPNEWAQINQQKLILSSEEFIEGQKAKVLELKKLGALLIDMRPNLKASPLFRHLWIKPISKQNLLQVLKPHRQLLQTVGLCSNVSEIFELSQLLTQAGVTRIRQLGSMQESYLGEPHDGLVTLKEYVRRVSLQLSHELNNLACLSEIGESGIKIDLQQVKVMGKEEFQKIEVRSQAELFFKSGGSSGDPKLSIFSYEDFWQQMKRASYGLVAAGLDPAKDRVMNLFVAGDMYGGFISFFKILEDLQVPQVPMAASTHFKEVIDSILKQKTNVLIGMPSYIMRLLFDYGDPLAQHQVIKKIFYGGEPLTEGQKNEIKQKFGVQLIKSAAYGSVDMGPLGYQCSHTDGNVHHLHQRIHYLEILELHADKPVSENELGRLVFSTRSRRGQKILRYDMGDIGRWVNGDCPCGRTAPRFELMGRTGDIFRAAGSFFNYQNISRNLSELGFDGELQVLLEKKDHKDHLQLFLSADQNKPIQFSTEDIIAKIPGMLDLVEKEKTLQFSLKQIGRSEFQRSLKSGKLKRVIDERPFTL